MKKVFAVVLCMCMIFTMAIGVSAYTINKDDAEIGADDIFGVTAVYFEDAEVEKGKDITVDIMIDGNPGVTEVIITLALPEGIAIKGVENGDVATASLNGNVITVTSQEAFDLDGCVAKVTFTASLEGQKKVTLSATAKNGGSKVKINGSECVIDVTAPQVVIVRGDADGDGDADTTDLAELKLYLADIKKEIGEGADADDNGSVNTTDLAELKLILAGVK